MSQVVSSFDPFLNDHIKKFGGAGRGVKKYLSSTACDELIELMGADVLDTDVSELQNAKLLSIIVDSTPDTSRVQQRTLVIKYVSKEGAVERFWGFV